MWRCNLSRISCASIAFSSVSSSRSLIHFLATENILLMIFLVCSTPFSVIEINTFLRSEGSSFRQTKPSFSRLSIRLVTLLFLSSRNLASVEGMISLSSYMRRRALFMVLCALVQPSSFRKHSVMLPSNFLLRCSISTCNLTNCSILSKLYLLNPVLNVETATIR